MHELINPAPITAALRPGWDRQRRFQDTLVLKESWTFELDGTLTPVIRPLCEADAYHDEALLSSLSACCETAPYKQGAELYLFGTAHPPRQDTTAMSVSITLASAHQKTWKKRLAVLGESHWHGGLFGHRRSPLKPLSPLPLRYEYAYGGTCVESDRRLLANPAGCGFNPDRGRLRDNRVPQIDWPDSPMTRPRQNTTPAGFAPLASFWEPRFQASGTFENDQLPEDGCPIALNARADLHNAAPLDQRFEQPFCGGEILTLQGFFADHAEAVALTLPALKPCVRDARGNQLNMTCDTLVIDCDNRELSRLHRVGLSQQRLKPQRHTLTVSL